MDVLISIIVPVYNISGYLRASIESILKQTYKNIEIIAVDDGSLDDSLRILRDLAAEDKRIHVLHQNNQGVTVARLTGLSVARGEWIGFVDGDDIIEPNMYECLLGNALKYKADISHCGYQMVFPDRIDYYYNTGLIQRHIQQEALVRLLGGETEPGLWNKLYHKTLFEKSVLEARMNKTIKVNEDLLMNYYLFRESRYSVFEDFCPYHYQVRKGSAATSPLNGYKLQDPIRVCEILVNETKGDKDLHTICVSNLATKLIRTAIRPKSENEEISECIRNARRQLHLLLPQLRKNPDISLRIKVLAEWATISPVSYRWIHRLYGEMTGKIHKYDVK